MADGQVLAGHQEGFKHRLHKQVFLQASILRHEHDCISGSIIACTEVCIVRNQADFALPRTIRRACPSHGEMNMAERVFCHLFCQHRQPM